MSPKDKHNQYTSSLRSHVEKTQLHAWEYLTTSAAKPSLKNWLRKNVYAIRIAINEVRRTALLRTDKLKKHMNELALVSHGWRSHDMARIDEMRKHAASMSSFSMLKRARLMDKSLTSWQKAKSKNNFDLLKPDLEKLIEDVRTEAQIKSSQFGYDSPYEALMDMHTPGLKLDLIEKLFDDYIALYPEILQDITSHKNLLEDSEVENLKTMSRQERCTFLRDRLHDYDVEEYDFKMSPRDQKKLMRRILKDMGFDLSKVRVGITEHSFCGGTTEDIRIGVHLHEDDFLRTIMDFFHEAGHGTYRLKLPNQWRKYSVGFIPGQGADEGLALFWEYGIGRMPCFAQYLSRIVTLELKKKYSFAPNVIEKRLKNMSMSSIRAYADELRYLLDLYVGYRVERELIEETLNIDDVPERWSQLMYDVTGIKVDNDNDGCLQDIHLPSGYIGYKPSYMIGRLFEHALIQKLQRSKDLGPKLNTLIRSGNLSEVTDWLEEHICGHGAIRATMDLYRDITGKKPDFSYLKTNVKQRYCS